MNPFEEPAAGNPHGGVCEGESTVRHDGPKRADGHAQSGDQPAEMLNRTRLLVYHLIAAYEPDCCKQRKHR